jgi:hypothetical protein
VSPTSDAVGVLAGVPGNVLESDNMYGRPLVGLARAALAAIASPSRRQCGAKLIQLIQFAAARPSLGPERVQGTFNDWKMAFVKPLGTASGRGSSDCRGCAAVLLGKCFRTRGFDAPPYARRRPATGVSVGTVALAGDEATLFLAVNEENAFALVETWKGSSGEPAGTSLTLQLITT